MKKMFLFFILSPASSFAQQRAEYEDTHGTVIHYLEENKPRDE
ncbi:MAG: hypothetical protein ACJ76F_13325 [Bacteroidia bacterium]